METGAAERLTFFSDAVTAIAMTLLAIDLPAPDSARAREFWQQVYQYIPEYFVYVISFVAIAAHWSTHHRVFRFISRSDDRLRWLNMVWLFAIVSIPFVTKVINGPGDWGVGGSEPSRFAIYAGAQLLANAAMVAILWHSVRSKLLRSDTPQAAIVLSYSHAFSLAGGFLLSIPLFFVWKGAWILWIVMPAVLNSVGRLVFPRKANRI